MSELGKAVIAYYAAFVTSLPRMTMGRKGILVGTALFLVYSWYVQ